MNDGCRYDRHNQSTLCAPLSLPLTAPGPATQCDPTVEEERRSTESLLAVTLATRGAARRGFIEAGRGVALRHRAGLQHTIPICAEWRCACRGEIGLSCARLPCAVSRGGGRFSCASAARSLPPSRRESGRQGRTTGCGVSPTRALRRGPQ